jgi:hypothetical protein
MPILQDIPIQVTAEEVLAGRGQRQLRPALLRDAEDVITLAQTLWQPRAVYDWFDLRTVNGERVQLSPPTQAEAVLHVGPKAHLLADARQVLVAVGTIGPALEQWVHDLQAAGEGLKSYLVDSAGVVALGSVGEALRCLAEEAATSRAWGLSAALSPGSLVGWSLQGQRELCSLLPLDTIDVRLNSASVLQPHKSFSTVIGLGPGYTSVTVGSVCRYCSLQDTCWRRREQPAHKNASAHLSSRFPKRAERGDRNASAHGNASA